MRKFIGASWCFAYDPEGVVEAGFVIFTVDIAVIWRRFESLVLMSPPPGVFREATTSFTVDARPLTKAGGDHIKALVRSPSGAAPDCLVTDNSDGTYGVEYTPFENGMTGEDLQSPKRMMKALCCSCMFDRGRASHHGRCARR